MDIGQIFSRSWEIVSKNKVLWIFGILAGCGSRNPTTGFSGGSNYSIDEREIASLPPELAPFFERMDRMVDDPVSFASFFLFLVCIIFVLYLFTLLVGSIGKAGVAKGVLQVDEGGTLESFGLLWEASSPYFLRVFGVNVAVGVILFFGLTGGIVLFILFSIVTFGIGTLLLCFILPALLVGAVFVTMFVEQANVAIVAEDASVGQAFSRAWEIVRGNKGNVIGVGVLIFVIRFVVMAVFGVVFLFIMGGVIFGLVAQTDFELVRAVWAGVGMTLMIWMIYIVVNGVLTTYTGAAWTLTYKGAVTAMAPIEVDRSVIEGNLDDEDEGVIKDE